MASSLKNVGDKLYAEVSVVGPTRLNLIANTQEERDGQLRQRIVDEVYSRNQIDAACLQWLKSGTWPIPARPVWALHYYDRLFAGMILAQWLLDNGFSIEKTEEELLRLFLIESWPDFGLRRLQSNLSHASR